MSSKPNATTDDLKTGILHSAGGFYVSNEGSKKQPNYHVWVPGITCSSCDSAYNDLSLAVSRCNYLAKEIGDNAIFSPIHKNKNGQWHMF